MTDYPSTSTVHNHIVTNDDERFIVKLSHFLLYIAILTSGFVLFEPAPFDPLILCTILIVLFSGAAIPRQIKWIMAIGFVHLMGSFFGVLMSDNLGDSNMHVIITAYMVIFCIGLIIMVYNNPKKIVDIIMKAYLWAALISSILAIMGYFHIGPTYELFTLYGRAKGGFKDPNVFAPFIVPPMLYLIEKIVHSNFKDKSLAVLKFSILLFALLLSFSRGAWGVFLFSSFLMFISLYYTAPSNRYRVELTLYILIAFVAMCVALVVAINIPAIADLVSQRASLSQDYDVAEGGRFSRHSDALRIVIQQPWGIGAKEFGVKFGEDVHNTYLTTFLIGGWVAGFSFLLAMLFTLVAGFKYCFTKFAMHKQFLIFYATFVSLAVEAWIIDIDHWRLLYIILGVLWGIIFYEKYNKLKPTNISTRYS
ncbi:MAG: O-antigen ligase family protein [Rhizobiales bacterium]|nr:O-antigen ligase family protein [Hyphomicrobiales bacterium]NRB14755.1 O-antigen ligase family protein [Hyphomicrobiales bacterium]